MNDDNSTTTPVDPQDQTQPVDETQIDDQTAVTESSAETTAEPLSQADADLSAAYNTLLKDLNDEQIARMQLMADFDNFRKRMEVDKAKFGAIANMQLIAQLLDIVDDVQLALNDPEANTGRGADALNIVTDKIVAALNSVGVDRVEIKTGDKFDPELMEALTTVPATSPEQGNTVSQVISSAFKFRQEGTLIKNAKVIVYKASA